MISIYAICEAATTDPNSQHT